MTDPPLNITLWQFWYKITRLLDRVQLSIYSTRAVLCTLWLWSTDENVFF